MISKRYRRYASVSIRRRQLDCDYYPLPAIGERFPVCDAALESRHTPRPADDAAFLHGLLEGIARIESLGYRRLHELGAPPLKRVFSVGGGARNPGWTAIRTRVLGVAPRPPRTREAAAGTAALALQVMARTMAGDREPALATRGYRINPLSCLGTSNSPD